MKSVQFIGLPYYELKKKLRPYVIIITAAISSAMVFLPPPDGLSRAGMNALAIFFLALVFWVTNAIPLMVTSMLALILLPLLHVMDSKDAYALFGNQAVFFILGAFILASAVMRSGLSMRIALLVLRRFEKNSTTLLIGILLLTAGLSFLMSEHAVAAMIFPIIYEITQAMKLKKGTAYGKALFLAMAWGCIIGGIATFLGGARALLALGMLEQTTGQTIGFIPWMLAALPTVIVLLVAAIFFLTRLVRHEQHAMQEATQYLEKRVHSMGALSQREKFIGLLMVATIVLWATLGHAVGIANIALGAVAFAFIFKMMSWKQAEQDVNWGIILMYGGAIALGSALDKSGAVAWIASNIFDNWMVSAPVLILLFCVLSEVLTEGMSNSAVIALLLPIGLFTGEKFGIDAKVITMAIAIPSGLAFMLPMSTPAVALAVSSKYVQTSDTAKYGVLLNAVSIIIFWVSALVYWPLIGFHV
ncbi:MAG: DASS family sodium-coupled anion symporter [Candidatus Kerfeldbacteria bacterium]|nr:DASS family sodium-coupled anion symporter [Candidatus Kerfeldbacteria bacterium]